MCNVLTEGLVPILDVTQDLSGRGKRHKPLQSYKFIGLEINTNISLRKSSGKTCTIVSDLRSATLAWIPAQGQGTPPSGQAAGIPSHCISSTSMAGLLPSASSRDLDITKAQWLIHNVRFTLIKLPIRKSMVSQNENQKAVVQELDSCADAAQKSVAPPRSAEGG